MTDRHKNPPIPVRFPDGDRAWLKEHARQTGQAVNAILARLLRAYRASQEEHPEDHAGCERLADASSWRSM